MAKLAEMGPTVANLRQQHALVVGGRQSDRLARGELTPQSDAPKKGKDKTECDA